MCAPHVKSDIINFMSKKSRRQHLLRTIFDTCNILESVKKTLTMIFSSTHSATTFSLFLLSDRRLPMLDVTKLSSKTTGLRRRKTIVSIQLEKSFKNQVDHRLHSSIAKKGFVPEHHAIMKSIDTGPKRLFPFSRKNHSRTKQIIDHIHQQLKRVTFQTITP